MSTRWSTVTKFWVLSVGTILIALTFYRLRELVPLVGLALILTYVINPVVNQICHNTRLGRTAATALVYLALLALLLTVPATFVPSLLEQASAIDRNVITNVIDTVISRIPTSSEVIVIPVLGQTIELTPVYEQIVDSLRSVSPDIATQTINFLKSFASGFASTLLGLFLILVLSFYLVKDSHIILEYLGSLVPPMYADEVTTLARHINQVWRAFLRGQLILCTVIGLVTWIGLSILGVPNALLLGIIAGILELIPNLGPILSAIPALLIAYFQGSAYLDISAGWFALIVALLYVGIQQIENTVLVPRIIGGSVNLHPVVVLIGVLAGASIAGILGIFLAAPLLASIRVIGSYAYQKLLEPPAPEPVAVAVEEVSPPAAEQERVPIIEEDRKIAPGGKQRETGQTAIADSPRLSHD
jgi:predicted PurR-regulated permease PerM